jgi:hypothetical protein
MAGIICARHGRTDKLFKGLCGEKRKPIDKTFESDERRILRTALEVPADVCGRPGLPECDECHHPAHPGLRCSTMIGPSGAHTEWCLCGASAERS